MAINVSGQLLFHRCVKGGHKPPCLQHVSALWPGGPTFFKLEQSALDSDRESITNGNKSRTKKLSFLEPRAKTSTVLLADEEGRLPFRPQFGPVPAPAAIRRDRTFF